MKYFYSLYIDLVLIINCSNNTNLMYGPQIFNDLFLIPQIADYTAFLNTNGQEWFTNYFILSFIARGLAGRVG